MVETAAGSGEISVPAEEGIFVGCEFNDAAELASVFGGIARGEEAKGFDGIGIHVGRERGRTVLHQRLAVDNKLHVVFGPAGMQRTIALVKPAGFLIDQIEEVAAGLEAELFADGLPAHGIERTGARRVDEREFIGHLDLCGDRRDSKGNAEFYGDFGVDFDDIAPGGETFGGQVEAIDAKGQILKDDVAIRGNLELALETVALAEEFTLGSETGAFWIAYFEMEFATEALGAGGCRRGKAVKAGEEREAN